MQKHFQQLVQDTIIYLKTCENQKFELSDTLFDFFSSDLQKTIQSTNPKKNKTQPRPAPAVQSFKSPPAILSSAPKTGLIKKMVFPKEEKKLKKKDFREPEKPACNMTLAFDHFKDLMQLIDPKIKILENIPNDIQAKEIASSWKLKSKVGKITLLVFQENKKELFFIKELAKALHLLFQPTKIINAVNLEKDNQWEAFLNQPHLKFLLITDVSLWKLKNLIAHYHENPTTHETFLGPVPLFLLPQISLYLKEPLIKKTLYESLKKKLHNLFFA